MPLLVNKDIIINFEAGVKYKWDIMIPSAPYPYNTWFPAISFEEGLLTIETHPFDFYLQGYQTLKGTQPVSISMEIYDDDKSTLLKYFQDWVAYMIPEGQFVRCLKDIVRNLFVIKYDRQNNEISRREYLVFPTGEINDSGSSDSEPKTLSINFYCAGS